MRAVPTLLMTMSAKQLREIFEAAASAAPSILFIDEIDSIAPKRGQVTGATNRPTLVDPALLRPGRFDELIYVPVPDQAGRERILAIHTGKMPLAQDVDLAAHLEDLSRRAGLFALRQSLTVETVTMAHFEGALEETRASVTPEMEREYE